MTNNYYYEQNEFIAPLTDGGSPDMNVDGSVTPVEFVYAPPADRVFEVKRIVGMWGTSGNINRFERFMSLNSALTNGVLGAYDNDSVTTALFNIQTNFDFGRILEADFFKNVIGSRDHLQFDYKISNNPIVLDGTKSDRFVVTIRDDIDGLESCGISLIGQLYEA